jgi:hypothetical protein
VVFHRLRWLRLIDEVRHPGQPPATGPHLALWKGGTGDPHAARADPGLLAISTDDVLQALASLPARHRISP